jgi:hypothetical protein
MEGEGGQIAGPGFRVSGTATVESHGRRPGFGTGDSGWERAGAFPPRAWWASGPDQFVFGGAGVLFAGGVGWPAPG